MLYELLLNVFEYNFWGRCFWKRIEKKNIFCFVGVQELSPGGKVRTGYFFSGKETQRMG